MKNLLLLILIILASYSYGQIQSSSTVYLGGIERNRQYIYDADTLKEVIEKDQNGDKTTHTFYNNGKILYVDFYERVGGSLWKIKSYRYVYRSRYVIFGGGTSAWSFKSKGLYYIEPTGIVTRFKISKNWYQDLCNTYYTWDTVNCTQEKYIPPNGYTVMKDYSYSRYLNPLYDKNKLLRIGYEGSKYYISGVQISNGDYMEYVVTESQNNYPTKVELWILGHKIRTITYTY